MIHERFLSFLMPALGISTLRLRSGITNKVTIDKEKSTGISYISPGETVVTFSDGGVVHVKSKTGDVMLVDDPKDRCVAVFEERRGSRPDFINAATASKPADIPLLGIAQVSYQGKQRSGR